MARITLNGNDYILNDKSKVSWSYVQTFSDLIRQREGVLTPEDNQVVSRLPYGWRNGIGWARQDRKTGRGVGGLRDSTWNTLWRQASYGILHEAQTHTDPLDHLVRYTNFKSDFWGLFEQDYTASALQSITVAKYQSSDDSWVCAGAPKFNAATTQESSTANPSVNHTVSSNGNRLLVVVASQTNTTDPTAFSWNGTALTQFVDVNLGGGPGVTAWYLVNPDAGAHTLTSTWTAVEHQLVVMDFYHVNQTTPVGTESTGTGTSTAVTLGSIASSRDDLVLLAAAVGGAVAITPDSGQTEISDSASTNITLGTSYERATGATTSSGAQWGSSQNYAAFGVEINGQGSVATTSSNAIGIRAFDMTVHKGELWVVGSEGEGNEQRAMVWSSTDGETFTKQNGTGWPTTSFFTTTQTRRNNFNDDLMRVLSFANTVMVAVRDDTNGEIEVWYSTDEGSNWTAGAVIPSSAGPKAFERWLDLFSSPAADSPVLVLAEGVYRVDSGGTTFDLMLGLDGDSDNGRFAVKGRDGDFYVGLGSGELIAIHPLGTGGKAIRTVGPPGDGLVAARQGHVNCIIAPEVPWLIVAYGGHEAGKTASVFAIEYSQRIDPDTERAYQVWHSLYSETDANVDLHMVGYSTEDDSTPRLHFALEGASSDEMYHQEQPFANPASGVTQKYQTSSTMQFAEDDQGDPLNDGTTHQARIEADNLGADNTTEYVEYKYGVNGGAWDATTQGNFLSGDLDLVHGSGAGVPAKTLRNTLVGHRDAADTTDTVLLKAFEVMATKTQQVLRRASLDISLYHSAQEQGTTTETVLSRLETVMTSSTKVAFSIGSLSSMFVRVRQPAAWELEAGEPGGGDGGSTGELTGVARIIVEEVLESSPTS